MFERYTEKARRTIFFARYEAAQFGSERIETEHLLLGLLREDAALAERYVGSSASVELIRRQIEAQTKPGDRLPLSADLPLSHAAKRVLSYAAKESSQLNHARIDTHHLLLGLMREDNTQAAQILRERGVRIEQVREHAAGVHDLKSAVRGGEPRDQDARSLRQAPGMPGPPFGLGGGIGRGMAGFGWMAALQDAGRVMFLARHEASERNSGCIETTDLLRAVASEKEFQDRFPGLADFIRTHPRPAPEMRRERASAQELPFSEDSKRAFTLAAQEAARLGQRTGPGHLLLGILGIESCAAAEVLRDCGLTAEGVRAKLTPPPPPSDPEQGRSYV